MEIITAENSGLCYGVKRALNIAKRTRRAMSGRVMTMGDLIHNPRVIADLEERSIHSMDSLDGVSDGTIIIRSHGISPATRRVLIKKKLKIVDATCPIVKKIQGLVESLARKKLEIVIVGNREHPEIQGLIGYSHGRGLIVENEKQAFLLPRRKKRAVVVQSTQDLHLFKKIVAGLLERTDELLVYNTICRSTQTRQKATSELASRVDALFIIGGKTSSNTAKLYRISKRTLPRTYFIESAGQIDRRMLKGTNVIGISGGASTPPEAIQEAVAKIQTSFEAKIQREKKVLCQM